MKSNRLAALFMLVLLLSPTVGIVYAQDGLSIGAQAQVLTVGVEETVYEPGDSVEIFGNAGSLVNVSIVVFDGYMNIFDLNVTTEEDGSYELEFELPEDAENGTYVVTASADGESIQAYFTVMIQDHEELAESLIIQAEDSKESLEDVFEDLEESGIEIPSNATDVYIQGTLALEAAMAHYDDGNYTEAGEYAYEAILRFGETYQIVQGLVPDETPGDDETPGTGDDDDDDEETGEPQGLNGIRVALERAHRYWSKLNATVARFEEDGHNVSDVREALDEAKAVLDEAAAHATEGNFTAAREDFTRARNVLGRINSLIQRMIKAHKEKQAEQFMEQFQRRIANMNGTIARIRDKLDNVKGQNFNEILNKTAKRLEQMRGRLSDEDLDDVLDELDDAVDEIEDGLEDLNGKDFSKQIKELNRVEATIRTLNRTAERLQRKGVNTTNTETELEDAEDLLEDLKDLLEAGEIDSVDEFLEDVKDRFDDLKDELKEERKKDRGRGNDNKKSEEAISNIRGRLQERKQDYDELREKLASLIEKLPELERREFNVSDARRYLQLAREKLSEALTQYEVDPELYDELMDEVERLMDKVEEMIEEFLEGLDESDFPDTDINENGRRREGRSEDDDDDSDEPESHEPEEEEPSENSTNSTVAATTTG